MVAPAEVGSDGSDEAVVVVGPLYAPDGFVLQQVGYAAVVLGHMPFEQ